MKKTYRFSFAIVLAFALYSGCKKGENNVAVGQGADQSIINSARQYFNQQTGSAMTATVTNSENKGQSPREQSGKSPVWDKAYIFPLSVGKAVVVPLHYEKKIWIQSNFGGSKIYLLDNIAKLLIYKDRNQGYHSEVLTVLPDSIQNGNNSFYGIMRIEDWAGDFINEYKYSKESVSKLGMAPGSQQSISATTVNDAISGGIKPDLASITVCYSIEEYNYSVDDPYNGISSSEDLGCSTYFYADDVGGGISPSGGDYGSIGGGGGSAGSTISVPGGNNIIANINDYDKCFTNIAGNSVTYRVSVCVSQPVSNSSQAWGFASSQTSSDNPVNVGHTFLIMTEITPTGTVTRNIGFYPKSLVTPTSPSSPGVLNDDEENAYNISLTINVDNGQFFNMLNFISREPGANYNLNSNNCSTFAINTLTVGDINLPVTAGSWPGGSGYDPGDLGQDIRFMTLPSNMTRSTTDPSHPNLGNCVE